MKRFLLALAAFFALGGLTIATAQVKLGIVGGMNVSKLSYDKDKYFDSDNRCGWYVGPKVWFTVPIVGLGVDASIQYSQRRLNGKVDNTSGKVSDSKNLNTFEVPINARYSLGLGSLIEVYGETGPQFGFNVGAKHVSDYVKFKSSNVTWNVGAGLRLLNHLEAGVVYNIALTNFGKIYVPDVSALTSNAKSNFKSNTWQIQAAYLF